MAVVPVLAQAPGPANGPSAAVFSPLAAPVMQAASMQGVSPERAIRMHQGATLQLDASVRL